MPNNFKLSVKGIFWLFTTNPNIGYERNKAEKYLILLVKLSIFALVWNPIASSFS